MAYFDRQFAESFRGAAHEEVINGEAQFMADMADVLTQETIAEGVYIDFGSKRERFKQVLDILNVDTFVKNDRLEVIQSVVNSGAGTRLIIGSGKVLEAVREHGALNTLEYMQSESWSTEKQYDIYPYITTYTNPATTSEIVFGNNDRNSEGEQFISKGTPIVAIHNTVRYSPTANDEYGNDTSLAYALENASYERGQSPRVFQQLLEQGALDELELHLPQQLYSMTVSSRFGVDGDMFFSQINAPVGHRYTVRNDRVVVYVDPYESNDDDF